MAADKPLWELAREVNDTAIEKGWWSGVLLKNVVGEKIALMHSELSEALEEWRNGHELHEVYMGGPHQQKPEGVPIELADCIIRILDFCAAAGIDIDEAMRVKMAYNKTRPFRHGGKRA